MSRRHVVTLALKLMGFWVLAVHGIPRVQMVAIFAFHTLGGGGGSGSEGMATSIQTSGWESVYIAGAAIFLIVYSRALGRFLCPAENAVEDGKKATPASDYSGVALSVLGVYVVVVAVVTLTRTGAEMLELSDISAHEDMRALAFRLTAQAVCGGIQLGLGVGLFLQRRGAATVWRLIQGRQRFD